MNGSEPVAAMDCRPAPKGRGRSQGAFTLLEVMIAIGIFFIAIFGILEVISQGLKSAQKLRQHGPTAGMLASEFSLTNRLEQESQSGDFELYPDYTWTRDVSLAGSNGFFRVDFAIFHRGLVDSTMSIFLYRPDSVMTPGGGFRR